MKLPRSFWLLFLLVFFSQCIPAAYFVLPSVLSQWNFSAEQIGLLMSSFYFGATLARSLGGWLVEKYGVRRSVILSGGAGAALGLLFLVRDFHVLCCCPGLPRARPLACFPWPVWPIRG